MTTTLPILSKSKNYVELKAVTWQKDSHGLFDYETKSLNVKKYRVDTSCKVCRDQNDIILQEGKKTPEDPQQKPLTTIIQTGDSFSILPGRDCVENDNYLIVRSLKNADGVQRGYVLNQGDVLKLGRMEYQVIEIKDEKGQIHSIKDVFNTETKMASCNEGAVHKQCKICLSEEEQADDPFITPCKCNGSCAFVHFSCLKQWLDSRGYKKESGCTIVYKSKKLECEVCQEPLPQRINYQGKTLDLASLERPEQPYIILENLQSDKKAQRGIYLIKGNGEEQVKLGRGHQCEIRISDISVSRLHAYIKFEKGSFIIVDNNSKFGTLVRIQNQYNIGLDKIAVQIGRTVITLVMKSFQNLNVGSNQQKIDSKNVNQITVQSKVVTKSSMISQFGFKKQ